MSNKIFHSSAGTKTHGMYHPNNLKPVARKAMPKNISADGKALVPRAGLQQVNLNNSMKLKADAKFIKKADKKLKGFKFGAGVGP